MIKVKRALVSVSDKSGLMDFARKLASLGVEIISTGGTAKLLRNAGIAVVEVSDYTGFPEILEGRVKTLQPKIHGGLLAVREKQSHMDQLKQHDIGLIDMVVVNLYPFERVIAKKKVSLDEAIENIDIGGPSMLRSAAKNFKSVAVVSSPNQYKEVLSELDVNSGIISDAVLKNLALDAFSLTAAYDRTISEFLNIRFKGSDLSSFPKDLSLKFSKMQELRYGENPHQSACFYSDGNSKSSGLVKAKQRHGKELSFNNLLDLDAAINFVKDFKNPAAVVIKHNNPTGVSENASLEKAYVDAWKCDPISAFGGIIGLNRKVDLKTAQRIVKSGFMECVIAPGYDKQAFGLLSKKKNLRILELNFKDIVVGGFDFKKINGGLLLQDKDVREVKSSEVKIVTKKKPTKTQLESMLFGWHVIKNVKSNAIVLVKGKATVGLGCGQTSRVGSVKIAIEKAGQKVKGTVLISDAFLPKTDNIDVAKKAGIKAIIQTGGSIADEEVIKAADKAGLAMVMTGVRHFRH